MVAVGRDDLPALPGAEVERAKAYARAARAASTRRVYASDWSRFAAWCTEHNRTEAFTSPGLSQANT
jgi:hypothetical protein